MRPRKPTRSGWKGLDAKQKRELQVEHFEGLPEDHRAAMLKVAAKRVEEKKAEAAAKKAKREKDEADLKAMGLDIAL